MISHGVAAVTIVIVAYMPQSVETTQPLKQESVVLVAEKLV
jgi:hypothetical protein